jgi:hypothetical protein
MIAWKVAVTHLALDNSGLDFTEGNGWMGLSHDTVKPLTPGGPLSVDGHARGRLTDGITLLLAIDAFLETGSPPSHMLIVPAGAIVCFPKKHAVRLAPRVNLPKGSKISWPRDSNHPVPELMPVLTRANDGAFSLWIREGADVTLTHDAELFFRKDD